MRGNEPPRQTDDITISQFVGRSTTAQTIPITGTRTLVREDRHHPRLTMTKFCLTMTKDHPVAPKVRTDTVQEGKQYPSHTMTNDSPPSPPTSRTPRILEIEGLKIELERKNDEIKYLTTTVVELDTMMDEFWVDVNKYMAETANQCKVLQE